MTLKALALTPVKGGVLLGQVSGFGPVGYTLRTLPMRTRMGELDHRCVPKHVRDIGGQVANDMPCLMRGQKTNLPPQPDYERYNEYAQNSVLGFDVVSDGNSVHSSRGARRIGS